MTNTIFLIGMPGGYEWLIVIGMLLLFLTLWLGAILDIFKGEFRSSNTKVLWVLVVIFLPVIGTILYLVMGKGQKI